MNISNLIVPFTIADNAIKGRVIKLDSELDKIITHHNYPEPITKILAELIMIASMIGTQFKEEVTLSVQLQTDDAVKYIIADFQSPNQIRGYAQFDNKVEYNRESYKEILKKAFLIVTIDRKIYNNQRYQGVVEINDMSISEAVEKYFYQSEQIKTAIRFAVGDLILPGQDPRICAGGIMIQKLPENDELWNDAMAYFATIRDDELLDPNNKLETLLYSLYHEMDVRIYDYISLINKCRCSREKAIEVLLSLGAKDAFELLVNNKIDINCQFCNQSQIFNKKDLEMIF